MSDGRTPSPAGSHWTAYAIADYAFDFPAGGSVLDVGCGPGDQLAMLATGGATPFGIDPGREDLARCRQRGFRVAQARAETLPFATARFDGVVCRVVLPYTDEGRAVAELGRVLRPGGTAHVVTHGPGYYVRYVAGLAGWKVAVYGARTVINTWVWTVSGRRLPGFLGDTLYQSERRLRALYMSAGLAIMDVRRGRRFLGLDTFLYHRLLKR